MGPLGPQLGFLSNTDLVVSNRPTLDKSLLGFHLTRYPGTGHETLHVKVPASGGGPRPWLPPVLGEGGFQPCFLLTQSPRKSGLSQDLTPGALVCPALL